MEASTITPGPGAPTIRHRPRERTSSWPLADRLCYWLCWGVGIGMCVVAVAIVVYMLVKGLSYLRPSLLVTSPAPSPRESQSGGFLDPIEGTLLVTAIGIAVAAPVGVALAVWLTEYRRPAWLARAAESAVEMIAGAPSVVLAIFGLILFARGFLGFLSQQAEDGTVTGESFITAGLIMSLLALPMIVAATRESLSQVPARTREASYALGKTRATTIRNVLLPSVRPGIATGTVLGMGRIIGDTAVITILLGASLRTEPGNGPPVIGLLRGSGSTLTSYVYTNSPAGEGNSPEKAYAAAVVLLAIVLALNAVVTRISRGGAVASGGRRSGTGANGARRRFLPSWVGRRLEW